MPKQSLMKPPDNSKRREDMVRTLNKVIEVFCSHDESTFDEVMTNVINPIANIMHIDRIFVDRFIDDGGGKRFRRLYRWSKTTSELTNENARLLPESVMLSEWMDALYQGKSINCSYSKASEKERMLLDAHNLKSITIVPVLTLGKFWGNIVFQNSESAEKTDCEPQLSRSEPDGEMAPELLSQEIGDESTRDDIIEDNMDLVQSFARLCAFTIIRHEMELEIVTQDEVNLKIAKMESSIIRLQSESEKIYLDPLTGIYNRRFFDENLSRIFKTLQRSGGVLSLMMIDIDCFKQFNDTFGHSAGDDCLRIVAGILTESTTREDDFVVRYGGDEFAVVLPNTEEDGACMIAEKMLDGIRSCKYPHRKDDSVSTITISIGLATGKIELRQRMDDFILRADELLYKSKQGGRDKLTYGRIQ